MSRFHRASGAGDQHDDEESQDSQDSLSSGQRDVHQKRMQNQLDGKSGERAQQDAKDELDADYEENVVKIVTVLFMSHRIQAKVFNSDTLTTFLERLRKILTNIDKHQ